MKCGSLVLPLALLLPGSSAAQTPADSAVIVQLAAGVISDRLPEGYAEAPFFCFTTAAGPIYPDSIGREAVSLPADSLHARHNSIARETISETIGIPSGEDCLDPTLSSSAPFTIFMTGLVFPTPASVVFSIGFGRDSYARYYQCSAARRADGTWDLSRECTWLAIAA